VPPRPLTSLAAAPPTDAALLAALFEDRAWALGALYDRYASLVYGLARAILASTPDAEDVTHEVFLGLLTRWNYDPERGSLAAFLVTVTRSRSLDRLRSRGRKLRLLRQWGEERETDAGWFDPSADASLAEIAESVRAALNELPGNQRQVLELAYFKGLSQTEIANTLEAPIGTVKSWARRGLLSLRHALRDRVSP
jgi:RNA polymerase sigma-70 factor (ECF subfamily)